MSIRRPFLRLTAVAGAAVLTLGLAGCGDVDAGSGALDRLHAIVDGWDETLDVDDDASNTLPWMGTASATVIVDSETPDDRLEAMTDELGTFLDDEDRGTAHWFSINLQVGEFRFDVAEGSTDRAQLFSAFEALRSDDRVLGGFVGAADDELVDTEESTGDDSPARLVNGTTNAVRAIVSDDVPLSEAYGIARSAADRVDDFDDSAVVAETEDGGSAVSDSTGITGGTTRSTAPTTSLGLASAIGSAATVRDVVATSDSLAIRLERATDVVAVRDRFETGARALGIDLTVNGGVVRDDGTAYPEVLAVAQSLDGVDGVTAVEVTGADITVTLADAARVTATINALLTHSDIGTVELITLEVGVDPDPGFSVSGPPEDLAHLAQMVTDTSGQAVLHRLTVSADSTRLDVTAHPDVDSLRSLFSALRPLLADGTTVHISAERDGGFTNDVSFVVADEIDIDLPTGTGDEETELAALVATAWATAG